MLNAARALSLNSESGKKLPEIPALTGLYQNGLVLRHGQVIMIAGRSGSQKSGFALWLADELDLDTLYFSADMSPFTASSRLASKRAGLTTDEVERALLEKGEHADAVFRAVEESKVRFSFGSPITWRAVDEELDAAVELFNKFPDVIIFDNLMDFEGAESDYTAQMAVMQSVTELSRDTGATVIVMHHASDKAWEAKTDPWSPPSRDQIKGGLSEKPEVSLSVALDPNTLNFNVAVVKQRMGPQDPSAKRWTTLRCEPELTRFHRKGL
jgi:hypothetical protein